MDCGCQARSEVLGIDQEQFINRSIIVGSALILLLSYGGTVTRSTQKLITIAFVGAASAILVDGLLKPAIRG